MSMFALWHRRFTLIWLLGRLRTLLFVQMTVESAACYPSRFSLGGRERKERAEGAVIYIPLEIQLEIR